jgi:branched-chain amino acid transport system permease protein
MTMKQRNVLYGAFAIVLLILPLIIRDNYNMHLIIMSMIFVLLASGLNLIVGYVGQLSLGHAAFFGIGAYTSALFNLNLGVSFWEGMVLAGVMAALIGFLLGYVTLRVRGHCFVLITIAFAEIFKLIHFNWVDLTHGQMGLSGISPPLLRIPGLMEIPFSTKGQYYYLALILVAVTIYVNSRLVHSRLGRAFIGIRENEMLAESVGINAFKYSMAAFVVGAFFAGIAGSYYAHYITFISPDLFSFSVTTTMIVMLVMGGKGTVVGPVVGAVIFTVLPEYLRIAEKLRLPIFGLILLIGIMYMPQGLIKVWENILFRLRARSHGNLT